MSSIWVIKLGHDWKEAGKCRSFIVFPELSRVFLMRFLVVQIDHLGFVFSGDF